MRCTSVGWAVSTGETKLPASVSTMVRRRNAGPAQARQRHVDAAFLGVAGAFVEGAAADVVAVFGQIDQMAEIGEGADHADGLVAAEADQQLLQRPVGVVVGMAPKRDRQLADLLDQFERGLAVLVADHVAQNAAEQADVFHQGAFVFAGAAGGFGLVLSAVMAG